MLRKLSQFRFTIEGDVHTPYTNHARSKYACHQNYVLQHTEIVQEPCGVRVVENQYKAVLTGL